MKKFLFLLTVICITIFSATMVYATADGIALTAEGGVLPTGTYYVPDGGITLGSSITIDEGAEVIIDLHGNTITSSLDKTIINNGELTIEDSEIGGRINATYAGTIYGIYQIKDTASITFQSGILNIENTGTSGSVYGIYATKGVCTIDDGIIQAYGPSTVYGVFGNSALPAQINNGIINLEVVDVTKIAKVVYNAKITGGRFSVYPINSEAIYGTFVTGGNFNFAPTNFIKPYSYKIQDGGTEAYTYRTGGTYTYSVVADNSPVNNVQNMTAGKMYANLQDAIDAAATGDTIKLLENYNTGNFSINIEKSLTLDLNGNTISGSADGVIIVNGGTEADPITITDSAATNHEDA